ncbi:hypothetical protein INT47_000484 [Mucor saturninus]|uniref:GID complex catalytic subunit 2 n=1 Tax=Mucor saturninus TaxID=64648 RepID=A0A8H7R1R6_9FUNG|nr:hypothetical protein INT47_000484 [Mucor saturninus]
MNTILNTCLDLQKKQAMMQDTQLEKLFAFKAMLQAQKEALSQNFSPQQSLLQIQDKAKNLQFQKPQKEYQSSLSKLNKELDRKFKQDISVIYHPEAFAGKKDLIARALALHFIRKGQFDLCEEFMNEAHIPIDDELRDMVEQLKSEFEQMYNILRQLEEEDDVTLAIKWAESHHDGLMKLGSSLEFNLHRLRYIQMLLMGKDLDAVEYGRTYLNKFGEKYNQEVQKLFGALAYISKLAGSPYEDLCSRSHWTDIRLEFQRDFCSLLKMSAESPLYTSVYVGTTALPVIMKLYTIMANKKAEWSAQNELPVEIPLEEDLRYHSVFACPVSKEQATEENPPMMMPCGHVICKESLIRLSRNGRSSSSKFKCPYCPNESSVEQAVQVYF